MTVNKRHDREISGCGKIGELFSKHLPPVLLLQTSSLSPHTVFMTAISVSHLFTVNNPAALHVKTITIISEGPNPPYFTSSDSSNQHLGLKQLGPRCLLTL